MTEHDQPRPTLPMKFGPVKVVEIMTWAPKGLQAVDCLGCETVPFEQVRHLCSVKPLHRRPQGPARA
jgi:hypothetical protein